MVNMHFNNTNDPTLSWTGLFSHLPSCRSKLVQLLNNKKHNCESFRSFTMEKIGNHLIIKRPQELLMGCQS